MNLIIGVLLFLTVLGVGLAVRERISGRGRIQTEADREAIRAEGIAHNHISGWHGH